MFFSEKDVEKSAHAIIVEIMILVKIILAKTIFSEKDVEKSTQAMGYDSASAAINVHPMDCSVNLSVHQVSCEDADGEDSDGGGDGDKENNSRDGGDNDDY